MSDHVLTLRYSDDGGYNFSNRRERDIGIDGEFRKRLRFQRLGMALERIYEIQCSSPRHCALISAVMIADTER